jgi:hypothetical protein
MLPNNRQDVSQLLRKKGSYGLASSYGFVATESIFATNHPSNEFSNSYDYVMVFPLNGSAHEFQSKVAKHALHEMLDAGLELFTYRSVQDDELIVLIRCPVSSFFLFLSFFLFTLSISYQNLKTLLTKLISS